MKEAYAVKRHIASLYAFLAMIRRPYLDVASKGRRAPESHEAANEAGSSQDAFARWQRTTSLSEAERDEVDFQVKLVIKQCLSRVNELERGEKLRSEAVARALQKAGVSGLSPFSLFQGSSLQKQKEASAMLGRHHTSVTQYLSEQLARVSSIQAMLQQRRVDAQRQRYEKLADTARQSTSSESRIAVSEESLRGTVGAIGEHGVDVVEQLSKDQVQAFEEEASALVESLEADLAAVQHAEQQLQDISSLQTKIVQHLQEQNEHVDTLLTEAGLHGEQVTRGNQQLRKAKERNRQANRLLSLFFIVSGLILLFMHWID
ncbi:SNARE complex protein [Malassezia pachydermatis]